MRPLRTESTAAIWGSLLLFASYPPLSLAPLAWFAPVLWLRSAVSDKPPGWRGYFQLWIAGWVFWALAIHWIRLPHPANWFSWLALTSYLACYLPLFIALCRTALARWRLPLWVAAPVIWTGLEYARAHLLTGFLMASLAHTQSSWTALIQISDLVGEYGVGFLVMLMPAALLSAWRSTSTSAGPQRKLFSWSVTGNLLPVVVVLVLALTYGHYRLRESRELADNSTQRQPRVALIQGNIVADWKADSERQRMIMRQHIELSQQALEMGRVAGGVDLIVWPETMYRNPLITVEDRDAADPQDRDTAARTRDELAKLVALLDNTPILVGLDRYHIPGPAHPDGPPTRIYNSVAMVDGVGSVVGYYDKMQRVMFGEYIPFADWMPWLYRFSPLTGGIQAGEQPISLVMNDVKYAPNICYESVLPHIIRHQVVHLAAADARPDVLVNVTNDAWFWGSSELDMHLACAVFRAVETRLPLLIAANGGISASIDANGTIRQQVPRQQQAVILAEVLLDPRESIYVRYGDWFAAICLICCLALGGHAWVAHRAPPARQSAEPAAGSQ